MIKRNKITEDAKTTKKAEEHKREGRIKNKRESDRKREEVGLKLAKCKKQEKERATKAR
ncbi:hypothetical protein CCP4SC76_5960004 [Gammaproteobacteria bacterium]